MQAYGPGLASIFNRRWTGFAVSAARGIIDFYESAHTGRNHRSLLDICCGAGQLALHFLKQGYRVVGLDASEYMLRYACMHAADFVKAGSARFVLGNAASFNIDERFGLAVSTFDSLNHLNNEDELMGCFQSVRRALEDDGVFIFDLNTRRGLSLWGGVTLNDACEEWNLIHRGFYNRETGKGGSHISGFIRRPDDAAEAFEETVVDTVFDLARVHAMLLETGWRRIHFARLNALNTPLEKPEEEPRVFIVACN